MTCWCARLWRSRNLASLGICGWQARCSDTRSKVACLKISQLWHELVTRSSGFLQSII